MILSSVLLLQILFFRTSFCQTEQNDKSNQTLFLTFDPLDIALKEGESILVRWNTTLFGVKNYRITVEDPAVGVVDEEGNSFEYYNSGELTASGEFNVTAKILGYNTIYLALLDSDDVVLEVAELKMIVVIAYQGINQFFTTSVGILLALVYVNMGATIDMDVVKQITKKPIGPILGIICQFGGMPLIAFGLSMLLFGDIPLFRIGMFMGGCVPGGGASNMWTHLLEGSLDLSIMMTFASTLISFGALPAWLFGLGPVVASEAKFHIPYGDIAIIAVMLIIPCAVGLLVQRFLPKVQKFLELTLSPFSLAIIIYIFTFGIYANKYIFHFFSWKVVLAGFALPTLGYLLGVLLSSIFRMTWKERIAIGIETGIQNMSIAVVVLNFTLPQPAGNLAVVVPASAVIMCPVPLTLLYIGKLIYGRCTKKDEMDITEPSKMGQDSTKVKDSNRMEMANGDESFKSNGIDNVAADLSDDLKA